MRAHLAEMHRELGGDDPTNNTAPSDEELAFLFKFGYIWGILDAVLVPAAPGTGVIAGKTFEILALGSVPVVESSGNDCEPVGFLQSTVSD